MQQLVFCPSKSKQCCVLFCKCDTTLHLCTLPHMTLFHNSFRRLHKSPFLTFVQVRTLRAAVLTKDKALAKGADDLARQHERAVKAEREYCESHLPNVINHQMLDRRF